METPRITLPLGTKPHLQAINIGIRSRSSVVFKPKLWALHYFFNHNGISYQGNYYAIEPGTITVRPPGHEWTIHYLDERCRQLYIHFMPSDSDSDHKVVLPFVMNPGNLPPDLQDRLEIVRHLFSFHSLRAEVMFWAFLLDLADYSGCAIDETSARNSYVRSACSLMSGKLERKMTLHDIAHETGVSAGHLSRQFQEEMGISPMKYLQQQRMNKAYYLITESSMQIKAVAWECGIPDLAHFSKLIRVYFNKSPRALRSEHLKRAE